MRARALFTASFVAWAPDYIATDDPQLLAHAMMLTGLLVLWRGHSPRSYHRGSVLMLIGRLHQHLLIPLPLATTLWLALRSRRGFWTWIAASSVTALLLCAATSVAYGPFFFADLLFGREYSVHHAISRTREALTLCLPALILTAVIVAHAWRSRKTEQSGDRARLRDALPGRCGHDRAHWRLVARASTRTPFRFPARLKHCSALGLEALQRWSRAGVSHGNPVSRRSARWDCLPCR